MGFYVDPAFFMLLVPILAGAVFLGVTERPLAVYGAGASLVMLLLLFSRDTAGLFACVLYLIWSYVLMRLVLKLFKQQHPHRVTLYRLALVAQLAPLVIYKVAALYGANIFGFLGISYLTFKSLQVLIEIRDGLIGSMSAFEYLYFLSFFPSFTSGPIARSRRFSQDLAAQRSRDDYLELLYRGIPWFLLGALYKFVAAPVASWALWFLPSVIGSDTALMSVLANVVYALAYTLYLFFDFAGYSHMACGCGLILGIELPVNFRSPFLALDIKDFWNRWHISLSSWLRDFVFMRFTTAAFEHKWLASSTFIACVGYLINMLLMGLWHGLTIDYVFYGLYHGILLAAFELIQRHWSFYRSHRRERWFKICSWALTMIAIVVGFAIFSGQLLNSPVG